MTKIEMAERLHATLVEIAGPEYEVRVREPLARAMVGDASALPAAQASTKAAWGVFIEGYVPRTVHLCQAIEALLDAAVSEEDAARKVNLAYTISLGRNPAT